MITSSTNVIPKHDKKVDEEAPSIRGTYNSLHQAKEMVYEFWQIFKPRPREQKISTNEDTIRTSRNSNPNKDSKSNNYI